MGYDWAAVLGELDWVDVTSSNVARVAYQPEFRRLWITFDPENGSGPRTYRYEDVPAEEYRFLLAAESKGKYVHRSIRANGTDSKYAYYEVG